MDMLWILQIVTTTWSLLLAPGAAIPITFTLAPESVVGGTSTIGTVTLSTAAPAGGATVTITHPAGTSIQAGALRLGIISFEGSTTLAIAEGSRTASFRVNTAGVAALTSATLTAKSGSDAVSTNLIIRPASITTVTFTPATVIGGQGASAVIALDGAAASGTGTTVQLAVGDGSISSINGSNTDLTAPATAHFSPGAQSLTVPVTTKPVNADRSMRLTATLGTTSSFGSLLISAPVVTSLVLNPSTVVSGNSATATVTLSGPAAELGKVIPLSANNAIVTVPPSVEVGAGSSQQTFQVTTSPVTTSGNTIVTITAQRVREGASRIADDTSNTIQIAENTQRAASATLTLLPAPVLGSFTLRPTKVKGGANVIAEIQLLPSVTSAQTITLTTDQPNIVQLPAAVSVRASGVATPFTITTHDVNQKIIATITATAGSQSIPVSLTIDK